MILYFKLILTCFVIIFIYAFLKGLRLRQDKKGKQIKAFLMILLLLFLCSSFGILLIKVTLEGNKYVKQFNILVFFLLLFLLLLFRKKKVVKKEDFFRNFPEEISIPSAIFLMKKRLLSKRALLGTTLYLYAKDSIAIDFEKEPWKYLIKKEIPLREDESYIYHFLLEKESKEKFSNKQLTTIVIQNLEKKNLIKKTKTNPYQIIALILLILVIFYALFFSYVPFEFAENTYHFLLILLIFFGFLTIQTSKKERYIPTKEGKILLKKLHAFQNYMIYFSHLKNRSLEEVILWKEYLAYAIALGVNVNYNSFKEEMPLLTKIELQEYIDTKIDTLSSLYD